MVGYSIKHIIIHLKDVVLSSAEGQLYLTTIHSHWFDMDCEMAAISFGAGYIALTEKATFIYQKFQRRK